MKERFIDKSSSEIIEEVRHNKKTLGTPLSVINGMPNYDKREKGSLFMFTVLYARGYYNRAKQEVDDPDEIIDKMITNSQAIVDSGGIKL